MSIRLSRLFLALSIISTQTRGRSLVTFRRPLLTLWHPRLSVRSMALITRPKIKAPGPKPILSQDDLFHPLSRSPFKDLRNRAELIMKRGTCPTCDTEHMHERAHMKQPVFECPDCGFPTHCSEDHWKRDLDEHKKFCGTFRQINEDEHDLRSGRRMAEFEFPTEQGDDEAINLANWDLFLYSRSFPSMDSDRSLRHVSKLLTFPITIASIMHELGPYKVGSGLTHEGLRSLAALRMTLYPRIATTNEGLILSSNDALRIFIVGARSESMLPAHVWVQLSYIFPNVSMHIHFIGPEAIPPGRKEPFHQTASQRISLTFDNSFYHDYHERVGPFDPYQDVFFLFSPGLGHPAARETMRLSISKMLATKCPIFLTGFDENDMMRDVKVMEEEHGNDMDWVLKPQENVFRSLKRDLNPMDLRDGIYSNWGVWGVRGKRYEVQGKEE